MWRVVGRVQVCMAQLFYLNLAVQRPITSPWQTSSALNSLPSSVRSVQQLGLVFVGMDDRGKLCLQISK